MKRFRSEKGTVFILPPKKKTRRKGSSRTKAFEMIAATHPASREAMPKPPADRPRHSEPLGPLLDQNRALRAQLETARERLREVEAVSAALRAAREQREKRLAQLMEEAARGKVDAAEIDRLRRTAEETTARLAAAEAESSELRGKLSARDKLVERLREEAERSGSLREENRVLGEELEAARGWLGKLESRHAVLMGERDQLAAELKRREERLAQLRKQAARGGAGAAELKRLRGVARDTQARLAVAEVESLRHKTRASARDKLLEQMQARAAQTSSLLGGKHTLEKDLQAARERLAKLESSLGQLKAERDRLTTELSRLRPDADKAAARLAAAEVECLKLKTRVAARDKLLEQLREGAARTSSLLGEKHALKRDLQAAGQRLARLESSSAGLKAERDRLSTELSRLRPDADKSAARLAAAQAEYSELKARASAKDEIIAQLRARAERDLRAARERLAEREDASAELDRLRGAAEAESSELRSQVSARDGLVERLRAEARDRADLAAESARLRKGLAEAEQRAEDAQARLVALLAERDDFEADLIKRGEGMKGVVEEIRAQAGRLDSVLDENHELRRELERRGARARSKTRSMRRTRKTTRIGRSPEEEADGPVT